jgi:hypothetical protein
VAAEDHAIPAHWIAAMNIFEHKGPIWETLQRAGAALDNAGARYAVIGGLACYLHGYRRNTIDVDLLVRAGDGDVVRSALTAAGFAYDEKQREFRWAGQVPLQLVFSGTFPGRASTSEIVFPEPDDPQSTERIEGLPTVTLPKLIELKLASALANPRRARDGADVMELIDIHRLDKTFAPRLNKAVRPEFKRLVDIVHSHPK